MTRVAILAILLSIAVLSAGCPTAPPAEIQVRVSPKSQAIQVGHTGQLAVSSPDTEDTSFTWTSSDVNIATVDATGVVVNVVGVAQGTATLTVTGSHSQKSDTAEVTVTLVPADEAAIAANEADALTDLCAVYEAQRAYRQDNGAYAADFNALLSANPPYLTGDWTIARNGYLFTLTVILDGEGSFTVNADPAEAGVTGRRFFFVDQTGVARYDDAAAATAASQPVAGNPCGAAEGEGEGEGEGQ